MYIGLWVHVIGVIQKEVSDSGQDLFTLCSHDVKNKNKKNPAKIHADFNLEEACVILHAALSDFFNS